MRKHDFRPFVVRRRAYAFGKNTKNIENAKDLTKTYARAGQLVESTGKCNMGVNLWRD